MDTLNGNTPLAVGKIGDQAGPRQLRITEADLTALQHELNRSAGRVSVCTGNEMRSRGQHMVDQRELQNAQQNHADLTARLAEATQRFFDQQAGALGIVAASVKVTGPLNFEVRAGDEIARVTAEGHKKFPGLAGTIAAHVSGETAASAATRADVDALAVNGVDEFGVGTFVTLKSGGPVMVIDSILPGGKRFCSWQETPTMRGINSFAPETLRAATPAELNAAGIDQHDANKPLTDAEREEAERQQRDAGQPAPAVPQPAIPVTDAPQQGDTVRKHIEDKGTERPVATFNADQFPPDGFQKGDFFRFMNGELAEHNGIDFGDPRPESEWLEIPADYPPQA